jgi:hypothetical protein
MIEEMKAIEDNGTWHMADLLPGHRVIGLKWIFKVKRDEHGAIVKHKARLVVKGCMQRQGVDYDEVFAPIAWLDSVQLLIGLATHQGWEVHHMSSQPFSTAIFRRRCLWNSQPDSWKLAVSTWSCASAKLSMFFTKHQECGM